jgi:hypothetical protein
MTINQDVDIELELEEETPDELEEAEFIAARAALEERASQAGLSIAEIPIEGEPPWLRLDIKCARDARPVLLSSSDAIRKVLAFDFENFAFLRQYEAIASYANGTIEAALRPVGVGFLPASQVFRRLFSNAGLREHFDISSIDINLPAPGIGLPSIRIGPASDSFCALVRGPSRLTITLSGCSISSHDESHRLLTRTADALFFQIDMMTGIPVHLERERRRIRQRRRRSRPDLSTALEYPRNEYDEAPASLYWYGRSASGMPLLQFLAFYQVVEFYFPVYAEAEAKRKLRAILKDPTFRGDREADIGRLLTGIQGSRTGSLGSELQQLKSTVNECVDHQDLRAFLSSDEDRKSFYSSKQKYHRIPISNPDLSVDLRADAAARIYDIRCGIVHTKNNSSDDVLLLLPFSKEADDLVHDIDLMEFVARSVLIAASVSFGIGG